MARTIITAITITGNYPGPGAPSTEALGNPNAGTIKTNAAKTSLPQKPNPLYSSNFPS